MAASARWLGRVRTALGYGSSVSTESREIGCLLGCTSTAVKHLPPPGYVLNSSGLLLPHTTTRTGLKKVDIWMDKLDSRIIKRAEKALGLYFRITTVAVGTAGCSFLLRLSWYESTTTAGKLYNYLPCDENHDCGKTIPEANTLFNEDCKMIVKEITEAKIVQFNSGLSTALEQYSLMEYVEKHLEEHKNMLEALGLSSVQLAAAQLVFLQMIMADAKWKLPRSEKNGVDLPKQEDSKVPAVVGTGTEDI